MAEGYKKSQWEQNIEKLNTKPEWHLFEVGPSGTLLGGDIELSKGPEDEFEAKIAGVKPGIWHVTLTYKKDDSGMDDFEYAIARWVAPGPLDVNNLSDTYPAPNLSPLTNWKRVDGYSVDSGSHGIVDSDGLEKVMASIDIEDEEEVKGFVLETISDLGHENKVTAEIGFVIGGNDGGYRLLTRSHEKQVVEVKVQPNWDDEDDGGDDAEDGEEEEEEDEE